MRRFLRVVLLRCLREVEAARDDHGLVDNNDLAVFDSEQGYLSLSHANIPVRRPSPREKHFGCPKPAGQVSEMPRGRPSMTDKNGRRVPFFGSPFFGQARKVRKKTESAFLHIPFAS
jgi:hypothetical protein